MRIWIGAAAVMALPALAGGAAAREQAPASDCRQVSPTSFLISGSITPATAQCVAAQLQPGTTELIVDSRGGNLDAALDIADRIAPARLTVRVRGVCHSACANYLIPVARRLVLEPGAYILLHGGADPFLLDADLTGRRESRVSELMRGQRVARAEAEALFERSVGQFGALIERQRAFARRYGVGLGWFIYREPGEERVGRYLSGERGPRPHPFGWRYLLAEEMLVRSCLPGVEIEPFQQQLEAHLINNPAEYRTFRRREGVRSLTLRCADPEPGRAQAGPAPSEGSIR